MYAMLRRDLIDAGLTIPTNNGYLPDEYVKKVFICSQPEELEDVFYNTIIVTRDLLPKIYLVNSIDLETFG